MSNTEWRCVRDFPGYAVTRDGRVANTRTHKQLKPMGPRHARHVGMRRAGKVYNRAINGLVTEAFDSRRGTPVAQFRYIWMMPDAKLFTSARAVADHLFVEVSGVTRALAGDRVRVADREVTTIYLTSQE